MSPRGAEHREARPRHLCQQWCQAQRARTKSNDLPSAAQRVDPWRVTSRPVPMRVRAPSRSRPASAPLAVQTGDVIAVHTSHEGTLTTATITNSGTAIDWQLIHDRQHSNGDLCGYLHYGIAVANAKHHFHDNAERDPLVARYSCGDRAPVGRGVLHARQQCRGGRFRHRAIKRRLCHRFWRGFRGCHVLRVFQRHRHGGRRWLGDRRHR